MAKMKPGIVKSQSGLDDIRWNILGQTYVPKQVTEACFSWHATLPPGTFVPPHIHPDQDEFLYILEGRFDFLLDGQEAIGEPGDLVKLPRGIPHAFWNKRDEQVRYIELSGGRGFEGFTDSTRFGAIRAGMQSDEKFGVKFYMDYALRLMKQHGCLQ